MCRYCDLCPYCGGCPDCGDCFCYEDEDFYDEGENDTMRDGYA
jgi:hypothetical protein